MASSEAIQQNALSAGTPQQPLKVSYRFNILLADDSNVISFGDLYSRAKAADGFLPTNPDSATRKRLKKRSENEKPSTESETAASDSRAIDAGEAEWNPTSSSTATASETKKSSKQSSGGGGGGSDSDSDNCSDPERAAQNAADDAYHRESRAHGSSGRLASVIHNIMEREATVRAHLRSKTKRKRLEKEEAREAAARRAKPKPSTATATNGNAAAASASAGDGTGAAATGDESKPKEKPKRRTAAKAGGDAYDISDDWIDDEEYIELAVTDDDQSDRSSAAETPTGRPGHGASVPSAYFDVLSSSDSDSDASKHQDTASRAERALDDDTSAASRPLNNDDSSQSQSQSQPAAKRRKKRILRPIASDSNNKDGGGSGSDSSAAVVKPRAKKLRLNTTGDAKVTKAGEDDDSDADNVKTLSIRISDSAQDSAAAEAGEEPIITITSSETSQQSRSRTYLRKPAAKNAKPAAESDEDHDMDPASISAAAATAKSAQASAATAASTAAMQLPVDLQRAIDRFREKVERYKQTHKLAKRIPQELEPHLARVAHVKNKHWPNKTPKAVASQLHQILDLSESTVKIKLKEAAAANADQPESSGSESANGSGSDADANSAAAAATKPKAIRKRITPKTEAKDSDASAPANPHADSKLAQLKHQLRTCVESDVIKQQTKAAAAAAAAAKKGSDENKTLSDTERVGDVAVVIDATQPSSQSQPEKKVKPKLFWSSATSAAFFALCSEVTAAKPNDPEKALQDLFKDIGSYWPKKLPLMQKYKKMKEKAETAPPPPPPPQQQQQQQQTTSSTSTSTSQSPLMPTSTPTSATNNSPKATFTFVHSKPLITSASTTTIGTTAVRHRKKRLTDSQQTTTTTTTTATSDDAKPASGSLSGNVISGAAPNRISTNSIINTAAPAPLPHLLPMSSPPRLYGTTASTSTSPPSPQMMFRMAAAAALHTQQPPHVLHHHIAPSAAIHHFSLSTNSSTAGVMPPPQTSPLSIRSPQSPIAALIHSANPLLPAASSPNERQSTSPLLQSPLLPRPPPR